MMMLETTFHIPPEWREAAEEITAERGAVMVMGAPGSGKTTFCLYLAGYFCRRGGRVAWIDADPGQPFVGPPAALSLSVFTDPADLLKHKQPLIMGFIGNTSPVGHLLDTVTSLRKLAAHAMHLSPHLTLINTCGLVNGGAARELMFHAVDIIAPRYVVAIQKKNEIEHLVAPHAHRAGLLIRRLPASPDARSSTGEARKAVREQRFKEYFRGADFQDIALGDVGIHGPGLGTGERLGFRDVNQLSKILQSIIIHAELSADRLFIVTEGDYAVDELYTARERYAVREVTVLKKSELEYLLIGLNDQENLCRAMGIIRDFDVRELSLRVITPLRDLSIVRHLSFGTLHVNPAGAELGQW